MAEHFRILGIRAIDPKYGDRVTHLEKVEDIHKAIWGHHDWLYFYGGVTIDQEQKTISLSKETLADFSLFDLNGLKVSVTAIVGKNGSGKSSIIELMIRLLNNLSAAELGEGFNYVAAEHLHFIDYVFGSLCFQIGRIIYILEERGRNIKLYSFERHRGSGLTFQLRDNKTIDVLEGSLDIRYTHKPLKRNSKYRYHLSKFFYTLTFNYSLYSFNYRDYLNEATPFERLTRISGVGKKDKLTDEDRVWLKGLFHKNDGYQAPIVLHPMRVDGLLDVSKENALAKERLMSLQFYQDKPGHYPFRSINGNLSIIAFKITALKEKYFSRGDQKMLESIGISRTRNVSKRFNQVYDAILRFWAEQYDFSVDLTSPSRNDAYDYVVYKTLKIVFNYKKYHSIFTYISRSDFEIGVLYEKLLPLSLDYSHVTKKLRRTIAYLKSDIYHLEQVYYNLDNLDSCITLFAREFSLPQNKKLSEIDLLPPPIFDVDLILSKDPDSRGYFCFSGLSSGERQLAYTISNCMYHLVNLNSSWDDTFKDKDHQSIIKYRYVNIVFDEVELFYHPEMQRQFLHFMIAALSGVQFENLSAINMILATHSPFILSDIPISNVLCLGDTQERSVETYGANIIDILGSSFFLDYTIGEEVRLRLQHIAELYNNREDKDAVIEFGKHESLYRKTIALIGDEYLKDTMQRMFNELNNRRKLN